MTFDPSDGYTDEWPPPSHRRRLVITVIVVLVVIGMLALAIGPFLPRSPRRVPVTTTPPTLVAAPWHSS